MQLKEKCIAFDEYRDQIQEYEDEADVLRSKFEKGEARWAQCYPEKKLALAAIDGAGKQPAPPGPTDLANGIASMQNSYTENFSGTESASLPPGLKEKQVEFGDGFTQMSTLASQLAVFEQDFRGNVAAAKATVATNVGPVGQAQTAVEGNGAVPGNARVSDEARQAEEAAAGGETVVHTRPQTAGSSDRPPSPDRAGGPAASAGGGVPAAVPGLPKQERAEYCSDEELMQRRHTDAKLPRGPVMTQGMDVSGEIDDKDC